MRLPLLEIRPQSTMPETGPRSIGAVRMLRLSLTDRCNFRCGYCMPAEGLKWLPKHELLTNDEIETVVRVAVEAHGISHIKLTGGEPTLRPDLEELITRLKAIDGVEDLSMTTNGFRLAGSADRLRAAGLDRVTVSLDSLRPDRFAAITRTGKLGPVFEGIEAALSAGFTATKINCVVVRGTNEDELADFAALTLRWPVTVRFIEYMPMGDSAILESAGDDLFRPVIGDDGQTRYTVADEEQGPAGGCGAQIRGGHSVFVPESEVRERVEDQLGPLEPVAREDEPGVGPAVPWRLARPDAIGRIGFISAMSEPFCATCNRLRLTATGVLRSCLFEGGEVDFKPLLRDPATAGDAQVLADAMTRCVALKPDVHSNHGNIQMSQIGG